MQEMQRAAAGGHPSIPWLIRPHQVNENPGDKAVVDAFFVGCLSIRRHGILQQIRQCFDCSNHSNCRNRFN